MGLIRKERYNKKHSSDGRPWGFNRIAGAQDGKTEIYMTRAWIGRLRFHLFHRGDQDPDCHDHPWGFWTFPLRSYVEEILHERVETVQRPLRGPTGDEVVTTYKEDITYYERETRVVRAFRWHYRPATFKHRVLGAAKKLKGGGYLWPGRFFSHEIGPVEAMNPGLIPTIVWRERKSREWGFTKERGLKWCWVPWITYVYEGGKHGPCE